MSRCKSCAQPIEWYRTITGKNIPVDPDPVLGGNIDIGFDRIAHVITPLPDTEAHVSHFTTCPSAAEHRRKQ